MSGLAKNSQKDAPSVKAEHGTRAIRMKMAQILKNYRQNQRFDKMRELMNSGQNTPWVVDVGSAN